MTSHRLRLNDLLLSAGDEPTDNDAGTWWLDVHGRDFSTGAPEQVEVTMRTLLQDGARVITTGYGNREVSFYVVIGGVNSSALAEAERVLALNLGRRGELGWLPPDGWAPETVFDVETSSMVAGSADDEDDLRELEHNERVYLLRFVCQPFVRSAVKSIVVVEDPSAPLDEDVLDAGASTARWTGLSGPVSVVSGGGALTVAPNSSRTTWAFTPVAPVDISTQPYITLVVAQASSLQIGCTVNGVNAQLVGVEPTVLVKTSGTLPAKRYYWRTEETTLNSLSFGTAYELLQFNDLRVRNLPYFSGTRRQSRRTISVNGSVRTQGALTLAAPTGSTLGMTVFYSSTAENAVPNLRAYYVSGGGSASNNTSAVFGSLQPLTTGAVFQVPVTDLAAGKCQILARLNGSGAASVSWTAQVVSAGGTARGPQVTGSQAVTLSGFDVVSLGVAALPPTDLPPGSSALVRITLTSTHGLDDAWLLNLDLGAVTVVNAAGRKRLWIETATTERPRPAVFVGDAEDKSDAFHDPALIKAWGVHEFASPVTNTLVVTTDCESPAMLFEFFPRYMNFVADEAS